MMRSEQELSVFSEIRGSENAEYLGLDADLRAQKRSSQSSTLKSVLGFLGRNLFWIALPALTFGGVAAYLVYQTPDTYIGEFQLLVEPVTSPEALLPTKSSEQAKQETLDYETLTRLLKSPNVLTGALPGIQSQGFTLSLEQLREGLMVARIGQDKTDIKETKLIRVAYESQSPERIQVVLDELVKRYLKYGEDERRNSLGGGVEFIEKQLPEVRQRVNILESQLQKLQQQYRISDLDGEGAALATRAREIEAQRQNIQSTLQAQQQLKANLEQQLKLTPNQVIAASQISENPNIQAFSGQLQQIEAAISIKSASLVEGHPELIQLKEQRRNLESALRRETQTALGANLPRQAVTLTQPQSELQKNLGQQLIATINEIQVLNIQNQALNQASTSIDQQLRQFPTVKRQYDDIKTKLDLDRQMLNKLLLQREEFRVQAAQQGVPWQIVSKPALLRNDKGELISTTDRGVQKIGLAMLGGLLLGLGAALLKEKRQDIFYGLDDLANTLDLNLLGAIPLDRELKSVSKSTVLMPSESDEETLHHYSYPHRMLKASENIYANLKSLVEEHPSRSLVIGSVMGGDGKTTLAINLAKAVAEMGQRVLLVDANMGMPQIHSRFGLPNFEGLSDVLTQDIDPNQLIQRSPLHANLFLLTAGQMSRKAHKLLASNQMTFVMERLQNMFDLVVYDTHSLQSNSGANFLALNAHGLLLVVGIKQTRRSLVLRSIERLRSSRIPVMGMVANFTSEPFNEPEIFGNDELNEPELTGIEIDDEFEIFRVNESQ